MKHTIYVRREKRSLGHPETAALVKKAALKETSLFALAEKCGIKEPEDFVRCFIAYDREVRRHGC